MPKEQQTVAKKHKTCEERKNAEPVQCRRSEEENIAWSWGQQHAEDSLTESDPHNQPTLHGLFMEYCKERKPRLRILITLKQSVVLTV